jgi:hypothetical protein
MERLMATGGGLRVLLFLSCDRALVLGAVAIALAIATHLGVPAPR